MKVKTIKAFFDIKEGVTRKLGDTFSVSNERYTELSSTKFGVLVEEVAEETKSESKQKSSPKKSAKK